MVKAAKLNRNDNYFNKKNCKNKNVSSNTTALCALTNEVYATFYYSCRINAKKEVISCSKKYNKNKM